MKIQIKTTPVMVLNCGISIGALAIIRSLGSQGIPLYGVVDDHQSPILKSRYCRHKFIKEFDERRPEEYSDFLMHVGKQLRRKLVLIPTSDELSIFVAEYEHQLSKYFIFPKNDSGLIKELANKEKMFKFAKKYYTFYTLSLPCPPR